MREKTEIFNLADLALRFFYQNRREEEMKKGMIRRGHKTDFKICLSNRSNEMQMNMCPLSICVCVYVNLAFCVLQNQNKAIIFVLLVH